MKRSGVYLLLCFLIATFASNAQLSGTKNVPGDYPTLSAAINDLNTQGVGTGGVTINLAGGNPQTAPAGGYNITVSGTVANPIILIGNNNVITAFAPQATGGLNDAIFKITGGDYITIQGFTMQENASNTTAIIASNNMTEWGVAVLNASSIDGAKNVTIQNNTISLNRTYLNTFGIYSSNRHDATNVTTVADITSLSGATDSFHIYTNNISNVNIPICVVGSLTGTFMARGLDIGGNGAGTGNTITNYGTGTGFSAYAGISAGVNGIFVISNLTVNISYNSITSSVGGTTAGALRGISIENAGGSNPTTTIIAFIVTHNIISIRSGIASGSLQGINIGIGSDFTSYDVSYNDFNNCGYTVSGTAVVNFISCAQPAGNANINNNTFTNLSINTSSLVTLINTAALPSGAVININGNSIVGTFTKSIAGNNFFGYRGIGSHTNVTETHSGNNFSNISLTGATTLTLWESNDGSAGSVLDKTITNNTFTNIVAGTQPVTILNVVNGTSGTVSGNTISNITASNNITAISSTTASLNISTNTIHTLSASGGAFTVTAISAVSGDNRDIYKNKIYNLESNNASGVVNGITVAVGTTLRIYNNLVGDLKTPSTNSTSDAIRGINLTSTTANSSIKVYHNTININASSTGTNFSSTGIFHTANAITTVASLTLSNNIIVNTSTPKGSGLIVAYRRSGSALNNFLPASNNNLFYAGIPGTNRLIFYDGTNSDQTLAAYKTRVGPRDINSITESPTFLSTTGSSPNFLHINGSVATQIEGGGISAAFVTDDYDGDPRNPSFPDIGADEFSGISNDINGPNITYTPLANTISTANRTIIVTITDLSGVASGGNAPLIYYRKGTSVSYTSSNATSVAGDDYTFTIAAGSLVPGDVVQYYIAAQDALGNVSTVPFGGSGATPPGSSAPSSPNQYAIINTYTWQGGTTDFQVPTNWVPTRTTPDVSDILVFDGSVTPNPVVTNVPNQTISKLILQSNVNATLNAAVAGNTLTLDHEVGQTVLNIQLGSTLSLGTTTALSLSYSATEGQTGTVAGNLALDQSSVFTVSNGSATNATTTVSGSITMNGSSNISGGSLAALIFNTGAILNFTKLNGIIPLATYNLNSFINVTGITSGTGLTWPSAIGGLTWNCAGQSSVFAMTGLTINGSLTILNTGTGSFSLGTTTINGNATLNNGTWNIAAATVTVLGNLVQNGGTIVKTAGTARIWSAASVSQTAGIINMNNTAGLYTLTATSGDMSFVGTVNGGISGGMTLAFTGPSNQLLNTTGANVSNLVGITVNKASGNCTLISDFVVNTGAAVMLTSGKLTVSASKVLTIISGASINGANSSNYIVTEASGANLGKLQYSGLTTSTQNFAIGTANNYMPVTITPTTSGSSFAAGVFEGATQDGTPNGTPISSPNINDIVNGEWLIDNSVVSSSGTISLNWPASLEGGNFANLANPEIGILRYNGSNYDIATGSGDNTANTATSTFSSFSPFIVGKIGNSCTPGTTATWTGTIDNDYNKPGNWNTGCVPTAAMNIIISSGTPTLTGGSASVKNVTIGAGATLNLNDGAVLNVKGDIVNDGTIVSGGSPDSGKTIFNGAVAQNISGSGIYANVEIDNAIDVMVLTDISVKTITMLPGAKLTVTTSKTLNVLQ